MTKKLRIQNETNVAITHTLKTIGLISACFSLISCDEAVDAVIDYHVDEALKDIDETLKDIETEANKNEEEQDVRPTSLVGLNFETFIIDSTTGEEGDYTWFHFTDASNVTTRYDAATDFSTYTYESIGLKTFEVIITRADEITGKNQINTLTFKFESQDQGYYREDFRELDSDIDEYHEGTFGIVPIQQ